VEAIERVRTPVTFSPTSGGFVTRATATNTSHSARLTGRRIDAATGYTRIMATHRNTPAYASGGLGVRLALARLITAAPVRVTGATISGPSLRGPVAIGALSLGAGAIGALAIGRLAIGRASIKKLTIEELDVRHLRVGELEVES
jgi:hypothetical protein